MQACRHQSVVHVRTAGTLLRLSLPPPSRPPLRPNRRAPAFAADDGKVLCDASCVSALESQEMVTTPSGLQYKEIKAGTGPQAITGYQVGPGASS